jgi:hypothetical protein
MYCNVLKSCEGRIPHENQIFSNELEGKNYWHQQIICIFDRHKMIGGHAK